MDTQLASLRSIAYDRFVISDLAGLMDAQADEVLRPSLLHEFYGRVTGQLKAHGSHVDMHHRVGLLVRKLESIPDADSGGVTSMKGESTSKLLRSLKSIFEIESSVANSREREQVRAPLLEETELRNLEKHTAKTLKELFPKSPDKADFPEGIDVLDVIRKADKLLNPWRQQRPQIVISEHPPEDKFQRILKTLDTVTNALAVQAGDLSAIKTEIGTLSEKCTIVATRLNSLSERMSSLPEALAIPLVVHTFLSGGQEGQGSLSTVAEPLLAASRELRIQVFHGGDEEATISSIQYERLREILKALELNLDKSSSSHKVELEITGFASSAPFGIIDDQKNFIRDPKSDELNFKLANDRAKKTEDALENIFVESGIDRSKFNVEIGRFWKSFAALKSAREQQLIDNPIEAEGYLPTPLEYLNRRSEIRIINAGVLGRVPPADAP